MLIVVTEPCCKRKLYECHKVDCYFKKQKEEIEKFLDKLLKQFKQSLEE